MSGSLPKSSPVDLDISGGENNTSSNVAGTAIIVAVDNIVDAVQACPPEQLFQQTIATAFFNEISMCVENRDGACFPLTYSKFKESKGVEVVEKFCNKAIESTMDVVQKFYTTMNDNPMRA